MAILMARKLKKVIILYIMIINLLSREPVCNWFLIFSKQTKLIKQSVRIKTQREKVKIIETSKQKELFTKQFLQKV